MSTQKRCIAGPMLVLTALLFLVSGCGPAAVGGEQTTVRIASAQEVALYPVTSSGGRTGYIDNTGKMAIPAQFAEALAFSEGLAAVRLEAFGLWGYVDGTGQMVIQPQFADASEFSEGLAAVRVDDRGSWGYCDVTGALVVSPRFASAYEFSEGLARVNADLESGYIDTSGTWVIRMVDSDHEAVGEFSGGLALVYDRATDLYGYVDKDGGMAIVPAYEEAWGFSQGLAAAKAPSAGGGSSEAALYGYIDKHGKWVIQPQFADARPFSEGLAAVQSASAGTWAYVDATGSLVIDDQWDKAEPFAEGVARVARLVGGNDDTGDIFGYGYITMDGKVIWQDAALAAFRSGTTVTTAASATTTTTTAAGGTTTTTSQL